MLSPERYEELVVHDFNELINNTDKKSPGDYTRNDNAVLIRYRVLCFHAQKRGHKKKVGAKRKTKKSLNTLLKDGAKTTNDQPARQPNKPSIDTPPSTISSKETPGFLHLPNTQTERKPSASSDPDTRKSGLMNFVSGGRAAISLEYSATGNHPVIPTPVADNKMAMEDDPGPFELVGAEKLAALGPVLVILPDDDSVDVVVVELSPLDIYYREKLRVDRHSMTYLSYIPTFDEMKKQGLTFQFYSAKKDYVSDSFAILRGLTNPIVAEVMDAEMPKCHNYKAHFEFLARNGEYQASRDSGNEAGGTGKGYRIDLGACDHNYDQENANGLAPTPRTNGGFKCCTKTGDNENDSHLEGIRTYFGSMMDAVQLIVDKVRFKFGFRRIFDDFMREEAYAAPVREQLHATKSRAEVSSNFATAVDGKDGCSFHTDKLNCPIDTYDFTACGATTVESTTTGRLYRAVTNLNSREACGRVMSGKTHFAVFNHGLETEMSRINASYKEVYGDGPDAPTANTFTKLYLSDDLPWVTKDDVEGDSVSYILVASAPSRDMFLSTAASAVYNMRQLDEGPGCHTTVGLLLICLYMSSYQQLHTILRTIKDDPCLLERIETDLPRVYWDTSEQLSPKFWGGAHARFVPSGFDFKLQFVDNNAKFEVAVSELKELLKLVNTSSDRSAVTSKIKEMADSSNLPYLHVFRLQLFIPLAALCGLVLPNHLFHADYIEPAEGVENGSFSALNTAGFPRHRHSATLLNICGQVGLPRRHSFGECLTCESHRRIKRFDLFMHGQDLLHLFLLDTGYLVQRKQFNSLVWEPLTVATDTELAFDDCA